MEIAFLSFILLLVIQTVLLAQARRHLRETNARVTAAFAAADSWGETCRRYEAVAATALETSSKWEELYKGAAATAARAQTVAEEAIAAAAHWESLYNRMAALQLQKLEGGV